MDDLEGGAVNDGVAVGVAATKMTGPDFFAAEEDAGFLCVDELGRGDVGGGVRLLVLDDVLAGLGRRDDDGGGDELDVATTVVLVVVGGEDVFDGLGGDGLDGGDDLVVVALVLVVDQDDALVGDQRGDARTMTVV